MEISLNKSEKKLLRKLDKAKTPIKLKTNKIGNLYHLGLITYTLYGEQQAGYGNYLITDYGKRYLINKKELNFKFWFPIILSNAIAFAALIISVIALLK